MKSFFFVLLFIITIFFISTSAQVISIAEAIEDLNGDYYPDRLGDTVTVQGTICSPEYGGYYTNYYIDDGTAGTRIIQSDIVLTFNMGDKVQITGILGQYFGTTNINGLDTTSITLISTGNPLPVPIVLSIAQYLADAETYEGSLIGFTWLTMVQGNWPSPGNSASVRFSDGIDTLDMWIDNETDIDDYPEPTWPRDIIAFGLQSTTSIPPNDGYGLLGRFYSDFLPPGTVPVEIILLNILEYTLEQNFPNPFNPTTIISYSVPEKEFVTLKVYDVLGNEIAALVNEEKHIGNYEIEFDATQLPSGIYFYKLQARDFVETKKMVLMK